MTVSDLYFNIYGDNIVECERTFSLIQSSLESLGLRVDGPYHSVSCPKIRLQVEKYKKSMIFTFFPGFGRWDRDILSTIRDRGGLLRESADAIITLVTPTSEVPLVAIEYCGALPAGNQAWQRNGRAYSFACAKIPYIYIAELGGYELNSERARKATRLPNPVVPFSYLTLSASFNTPALPVFVPSAGAGIESIKSYSKIFGSHDLLRLIRNIILSENCQDAIDSLKRKVIELAACVRIY